jgi:hypothetical protein
MDSKKGKMQLTKLVAAAIFFFALYLVLQLTPEVTTANAAVETAWETATQNADMLMMGILVPWGAPLICISIVVTMGLSLKRMTKGFDMMDLISPIVRIFAAIFLLNFFPGIVTTMNTNLAASTNAMADIFWGIIPAASYLLLIAVTGGWDLFSAAKDKWGKGGKKAGTAGAGYAGGNP